MTPIQPPRLATWFVKHLGCAEDNDAVIGDLAERYAQGKTAIWYWRQVVVAIVVSAFNDIREHKLITLRALAVGWPVFWYLGAWTFELLATLINTRLVQLLYSTSPALYWFCDSVVGTFLMLAIGMTAGWIISRLNWRHRRSIVLLFSFCVLLSWIYYGWTATVDDIGGSPWWEVYFWMNCILQAFGVLAGGLVGKREPSWLKS